MLNPLTVTFNPNGGILAEGEGTKTVYYGQKYGTLPVPKRDYHSFAGWYTAAEGGDLVSQDAQVHVTNNITLYAHWTQNAFTLTFNPNGGYVSETSRVVSCGEAYGTLPIPTRDYYDFTGWYTAVEGGELVTSATIRDSAENITIHAQWKLNDLSDWVPTSSVPSGAQVVNQKWTYTKTTTTESREPSLAGYTHIGDYWVQSGSGSTNYATFPNGFDKTHNIYTSFAKAPYTASETLTTKREVTSGAWAGYVYWHWAYSLREPGSATRRVISSTYGTSILSNGPATLFGAHTSSTNLPVDTNQWPQYGAGTYYVGSSLWTSYEEAQGSIWWYRFDYYTSTYTDYYKMFQYQKVENLESSTQVTASGNISNVQEWVQYRAK